MRSVNGCYAPVLEVPRIFLVPRKRTWLDGRRCPARGQKTAALLMKVAMDVTQSLPRFPTLAGILFGLGLGGFFDGIVLH